MVELRMFHWRKLGVLASMLGAVALSGCGSSNPVEAVTAALSSISKDMGLSSTISQADAVRLAKQGSFGPTQALADHIVALGSAGAWIDEQTALTDSNYSDLTSRTVLTTYCNAQTGTALTICNRDYFSQTPLGMEFYAHAVQNNDQLRQRVAFALSQLLVASDVEVHTTAGIAAYNQIFLNNAFGNYKDILKAVTLSPFMGSYLNLANSSKSAPNENYARELMQLFSIGLNQLNADGTAIHDATGATVATYTADDVHAVARALTGWTYARLNGAPVSDNTALDYSSPMIKLATNYDTTAKTFLGVTVPANASQDASLDAVMTAVFNAPSTAPYVSKFLIQQLVTSNPSSAYVGRVSAVFANNGSGVRGDLKAVVKAILTDSEARGDAKAGQSDGKVKEPVLLLTSVGRLLNETTDGYAFVARDQALGQQPFRAPSVFNFYPPDYPLPLSNGVISPPSKLITAATDIARHNLVYDWTVSGDATSRSEYTIQTTINGATGTAPNWAALEALGGNTSNLVAWLNLYLLNNTMTSAQQAALANAVNAVTNTNATTQAHKRAQVALYIVLSSPQFQVDR